MFLLSGLLTVESQSRTHYCFLWPSGVARGGLVCSVFSLLTVALLTDGLASLLDCECPAATPGPAVCWSSSGSQHLGSWAVLCGPGPAGSSEGLWLVLPRTTRQHRQTNYSQGTSHLLLLSVSLLILWPLQEPGYAVPVIHLPEETGGDLAKVAADVILDMFPKDLLENNKKVRPIDVKIIEHDGYIDYEIEFIELSDYYDYYLDDLEIKDVTTESSTTGHQFSGPELSFVDLLKQARQQHRQEGARPAGETTTARR